MKQTWKYVFTWSVRALVLSATLWMPQGTYSIAIAQTSTSSSPAYVVGQSATILPNGQWLLTGGGTNSEVSNSIEMSDAGSAAAATPYSLSLTLIHARTGHTGTVLPNGTVLILGGTDSNGVPIAEPEIVDLKNWTVTSIANDGIAPRTRHTATLLTDGRVLIVGGVDASGKAIAAAQLWNPSTQQVEPWSPELLNARYDHEAMLLNSGEGLIRGGQTGNAQIQLAPELYNPNTNLFESVSSIDSSRTQSLSLTSFVADSLPAANAAGVPVDTRVSIRFTNPARIESVNAATISVVGKNGSIVGNVVGAERGMLAFFTPSTDLLPDSTYTVFVKGVRDVNGAELPLTTFKFTTRRYQSTPNQASTTLSSILQNDGSTTTTNSLQAQVAATSAAATTKSIKTAASNKKSEQPTDDSSDDDFEDWTPQDRNRHGQWRVLGLSGDPILNRASIVDLQAATGITAVAGHVERFQGKPLAGVTVSIAGHSSVTDSQGRFLVTGVESGKRQLKIDGTTAATKGRHYTKHFLEVNVADGVTTALSNPVYLPRVDPAQEITISSPADHEIVLTHPAIPGLEVHIPKGAVLREYDGKIVTKLSITPVPIDRAPYPTPANFSVYFTLQPGGAFVDGNDPDMAVKIIYPNYQGYAPGTQVDFWNYDPSGGGWGVYGQGVVSKDGKKIIPGAGVGFRQIMTFGYAIGQSITPPTSGPPLGGCETGGDPVDCATGLFLHSGTDLYIKDVIPISVSRTYRQNDNTSRALGLGANLSYSMYLYSGSASNVNDVYLIMADGGRVHYTLQSTSPYLWKCSDSPTGFYGSTLAEDTVNHGYQITMVDKTVLSFANHSPNQLLGITDPNGNTVTVTLSGGNAGNITQVTSPNGRYIQFSYDSLNRITQATDNLGRSATYQYDSGGRLWTATDPNGGVEQYGYDSSNRMTTVNDKNGNTMVTNVYDANGRVQQQTLADGAVWQFAYTLDANSNVTQTDVTNPRGYVTRDVFNTGGFVTSKIEAVGQPEQQTTTYTRGTSNLVTQIVDPLSRTTNFVYDTYGMMTSRTRLYGTSNAVTDNFTYDSTLHQLTLYRDPLSHSTTLAYDSLGNLVSVTDALSHKTTIVRNAQGLPTSLTDALNHQTIINYQQSDLSAVQDALGRTTNFFTDMAGRVISVSDPLGNSSQYTYDPLDRVLNVTDPQGGITAMSYDANGNLLTVTDARNLGVHTYAYDVRDRLHTYTDPLGLTETYNYDGAGNLISKVDRKSQTTGFTYDALNRVRVVTFADATTLTITWDSGDRPTQFVDSANGTITRIYDGLDRLTEEVTPQGQLDYQYDTANRRTQLTIAGQSTPITYSYDNANRLTQIAQGSTTVGLGYDNANRRTTITLPNGVVKTLTYDNADELLAIAFDKGTTHVGDLGYTYDGAGRRITQSGSLAKLIMPTSITTAAYDAANHLTNWGGTTLTYDNDGNLINLGTSTYTWNSRNQLTNTSDGASSFGYDAFGRRKTRTVSGTTNTYMHDALNPVMVNSALMLEGAGLDEFYARVSAGTVTSYLTDALGSTLGLTDSTTATTASYAYGAYGTVSKTGTDDTTFQFTGRENDGTANINYYRNRYYNPSLDRFISDDPIGLVGGINASAYVGGNPISFVDPYGLFGMDDVYGAVYDATGGWTPSQGLIDYTAGLGDAVSLNATSLVRDQMGTNDAVNKCSGAYRAGGWSSFALGAGRLAYAGLAKGYSVIAASGTAASSFRAGLRVAFGGGKSLRPPDLTKYATDAALRAAAGRTNPYVNAYGAAVAAKGATQGSGSSCGCSQ